ncbi:hypothetical protein [Paraburkholderia domus]|nr:hypothetical protein [Paraburkholderia domus]MBK5091489.1 hypothetical protein [Burkholderia sp. R-69927]MBK5169912.1 hypothetical protein [Burkholderia sp. R-70211]MBK5186095.1 hypothetical protein [Burkholderia sp. R-69749]
MAVRAKAKQGTSLQKTTDIAYRILHNRQECKKRMGERMHGALRNQ